MATKPRKLALVAGALALGSGSLLWAAEGAPKPELISGASARMLAETCAGCHGTDGASVGPASPTIGGMNAEYFVEIMEGFRDDSIYSTVMGRIAKGYSDEEIAAMAGFFAGRPYVPAKQEFDAKLADKGAKQAMLDDPHLLAGLNVHRGMVTYKDVARDLGYEYVPALKALETA